MSKQEWIDKWDEHADNFFLTENGIQDPVDFFYSLHLDHIKAIREMIIKLDSKIQNDFLTEAILENPLLTIAE